jgi:hypothetical protein
MYTKYENICMYKVLKDSQKEFADLTQISCDDIETSVAVGRKFVARLYDPKARFTCDHGDLNKLRSRIAQQKDDKVFPLQVHSKSCKKSDDVCPSK